MIKAFIKKAILFVLFVNYKSCFAPQEFVVQSIPKEVLPQFDFSEFEDQEVITSCVAYTQAIIKIWNGLQSNLQQFYFQATERSLQDWSMVQKEILARVILLQSDVLQFCQSFACIEDFQIQSSIKRHFDAQIERLIVRVSESIKKMAILEPDLGFSERYLLGSLLSDDYDDKENKGLYIAVKPILKRPSANAHLLERRTVSFAPDNQICLI